MFKLHKLIGSLPGCVTPADLARLNQSLLLSIVSALCHMHSRMVHQELHVTNVLLHLISQPCKVVLA